MEIVHCFNATDCNKIRDKKSNKLFEPVSCDLQCFLVGSCFCVECRLLEQNKTLGAKTEQNKTFRAKQNFHKVSLAVELRVSRQFDAFACYKVLKNPIYILNLI